MSFLDEEQKLVVQEEVKKAVNEKMEDTEWPGWGPLIALLVGTGVLSYPAGRTVRKSILNSGKE
jgi:hypothetical protein